MNRLGIWRLGDSKRVGRGREWAVLERGENEGRDKWEGHRGRGRGM